VWKWRFAVAWLWSVLLVAGSLLNVSAKKALGTTGALHYPIHFAAFAITAVLIGLCGKTEAQRIRLALCAWGIGFGVEVLQTLCYGNAFEYWDVGVDSMGAWVGWVTLKLRHSESEGDRCSGR
jgi:hypothetical protein